MSVQTLARHDGFLRRALLLNALFETALGVGGIVAANALAEWTGLLTPTLFTLLGIGCLGYSVVFYWMVAQPQINRPLARALMLVNDAFAIAALLVAVGRSALIVAWGSFTCIRGTLAHRYLGSQPRCGHSRGVFEYEELRRLR